MSMVLGKICSQVEDYVCWRVSFAMTSWKIDRTRSCCFETYEIRLKMMIWERYVYVSVQKGLFIAIWRYVPPVIQYVTFLSLWKGHLIHQKKCDISGAYGFSAKFQFLCSNGSCLGTFRFWKRLAHYLKLDATEVWFGWWKPCDKKMEWICKFGMFEPPLTKRNKRSPFAVCTPAPYKRVGSLHPRDPITSWEW